MSIKRKVIVLASVVLAITSCCDSPLEDVELEDFSLVRATFHAKRIYGDYPNQSVSVVCFDKNGKAFLPKGMTIAVNGVYMKPTPSSVLLDLYTIAPSSLQLMGDSSYSFVMTLPNGKSCRSIVHMPKVDFRVFETSPTFTFETGIVASWTPSPTNPLQCRLIVDYIKKAETSQAYATDTVLNTVIAKDSTGTVKTGKIIPSKFNPAVDSVKTVELNFFRKARLEYASELMPQNSSGTVEMNDIGFYIIRKLAFQK